MEELIDAFEDENENITVELESIPFEDYWTKMQVDAQGGNAADAFWMLGDHFQIYAGNDQLLSLDDAIEGAGVDMNVYPEALVDLFTYDGVRYGLPKDFDTVGLWYNEELFDEADVEYPTEDWTWDDVRETAEELTNDDFYGIAAPVNRQEGYYNTIAQAGGEVISEEATTSGYDQPETQEGLQFWVDLQQDGSSPSLEQLADTEAVAQFENENVAMYYGGSFYAERFYEDEDLRDKVDVTVLPEGEQRATTINGIQNVGYADTDHPEELEEFLLFLGSEEAANIQAETGSVIPAYEGTQEAWVDSMPEFNLDVFLDQADDGVIYPVSENTAVWNDFEEDELAKAWDGTEPVKEVADRLADRMNDALAEE